jgi:hypothetical protein
MGDAPASVDSATILTALLLCGLMGLLGQGIRAAIGLKSFKLLDQRAPDGQTAFSAAYFLLSMMIGFIAGVLAGLAIGISNFIKLNPADLKLLLGIVVSGYAGADFIENTLSIVIPGASPKQPAPSQPASSPPAPVPAGRSDAAPGAIDSELSDSVGRAFVASVAPANAAGHSRELTEALKYKDDIAAAASACGLDPLLICAVGSRESAWGLTLRPPGPAGTGDWTPRNPAKWGYAMPPDHLGWGRGLLQVDYQQEFGKTGAWRDPAQNIMHGATELAQNIAFFRRAGHPNVDPVRAGIAAYNCGRGGVLKAIENNLDIDRYTTGHDYSQDVLRRMQWFQGKGIG